MEVSIDSVQKIPGPCYPLCGQPGADEPALCDPALNELKITFTDKTLSQAEILVLDQQWRAADVKNNNYDPLVFHRWFFGD